MMGNFMQQVALGWLIYDLTSSPTWLGIASFARGIPMLLFSLPSRGAGQPLRSAEGADHRPGAHRLVALSLAALIATV